VLHISNLIPLIFLADRLGLLSAEFWSALMRGDITGMTQAIRNATVANFQQPAGIGYTIAGAVCVALTTALLRYAAKGSTVSLRKPKAIAV